MMKRMIKIVIFSVLIFTLSCSFFGVNSFHDDVFSLIADLDSWISEMACEENVTIRSGGCSFQASQQTKDFLVERLNLKEIELQSKEAEKIFSAKKSKCSRDLYNFDYLKVYQGGKKKLESGATFEFVNLYFNTQNNVGCIEVSYSYG